MSATNFESWDMAELVTLHPDHPGRAEVQRRLAQMTGEERDAWMAIIADCTALRRGLADVTPMSPDLAQRLSRVPERSGWAARARRALSQPVGWRHLAAVLIIGAGVGLYLNWQARPRFIVPLDKGIAASVAELALANHVHGPPLELASSDPGKVQSALSAHQLPFAPQLLANSGDCTLVGEAIVPFGSTVAAMTRWEHRGATWSMYQFSAKAFDAPAAFLQTTYDSGEGKLRRRVSIWPGATGECTWALVMEGDDDAPNPFFGGGYGPPSK
jgi:hypothetical protein